jgi:hydroxymethylpyrimidine/phosphomethylpyrimidine kinase
VQIVAEQLQLCRDVPLVLDTIIRASSGAVLLDDEGVRALQALLLPRATLITPNRQEAAVLFPGMDEEDIRQWSHNTGVAVLLTGGDSHLALAGEPRYCTDILVTPDNIEHLTLPRVETVNHHGTGCALTAAIAAFLAHGFALPDAVQYARHFVHRALLGARSQQWPGNGPLHHFFAFADSPAVNGAAQPLEETT